MSGAVLTSRVKLRRGRWPGRRRAGCAVCRPLETSVRSTGRPDPRDRTGPSAQELSGGDAKQTARIWPSCHCSHWKICMKNGKCFLHISFALRFLHLMWSISSHHISSMNLTMSYELMQRFVCYLVLEKSMLRLNAFCVVPRVVVQTYFSWHICAEWNMFPMFFSEIYVGVESSYWYNFTRQI